MKILITGAEGFVGSAICEELSGENFRIYKIVRRRNQNSRIGNENYLTADITNLRELENLEFSEKIDIVINCAGLAHQFGKISYEDFEKVNVRGAENVCDLAVRLNALHFLQISSVSVYGSKINKTDKIIDETRICKPDGFYGLSKLEGEKIVRRICEENNIKLSILRLATVIGEEDGGNVLKLIKAIERKRFVWIGRGTNLKSLVYKKDVGRACKLLIGKKTAGTEIFNISAKPLPMSRIVGEIEKVLEVSPPKFHISAELIQNLLKINKLFGIGKIEKLAGTLQKWLADDAYSADKIYEHYGFRTKTDISEALRREILWYKNRKK